MYRKVFNMLSLLVVLAVAFSAVAPAAASPRYDGSDASEEQQGEVEESSNGIYIVQMIDDPAVAYAGGISGLNPTKPAEGENLNSEDPDVVEYVNHLDGEHERAISESGGQKLYDYGYTYNGFAAEMTLEEAQKMTKVDGVLRVTPDTLLKLDTSSTSTFLGLDAKKGLWKKLGGNQNAGKGVVVGIVDSGLWPENPSFSDRFDDDTDTWTTDGTGEVKYKLTLMLLLVTPRSLADSTSTLATAAMQVFRRRSRGNISQLAMRIVTALTLPALLLVTMVLMRPLMELTSARSAVWLLMLKFQCTKYVGVATQEAVSALTVLPPLIRLLLMAWM